MKVSDVIFLILLAGLPGLGALDWYCIWQMRRSLPPELAQFKGYKDWRHEGRRFSLMRDPSAYNERGKKFRRVSIIVEFLMLPWPFLVLATFVLMAK